MARGRMAEPAPTVAATDPVVVVVEVAAAAIHPVAKAVVVAEARH